MLDDMFHRLSSRFTAGSGTEGGKSWRHRETAPQRRVRQGKGRHGNKTGQRHRRRNDGRQKGTETVTCRVGSERSPCPVLMCSWRQEADVRWECDVKAATNWDFRNCKKTAPSGCFSLPLYLCVVGRFACQVPLLSPTRTAIPERFFGLKITIGNFLSRKPEARTRRYSPSELSSPGDLSSEAKPMMPFHGKIWKQINTHIKASISNKNE